MTPIQALRRSATVALVLALWSGSAQARPFEVATFAVDPGQPVAGLRVATAPDGTMTFLWHTGGTVTSQWFSATGSALAAPALVASGTGSVRIAADTRGGYVAAFTRVVGSTRHLFGRLLDGAGQPLGGELDVDGGAENDVALPTVIGLSSGAVFVWQRGAQAWARLYDAAGAPRGIPFVVGDNGYGFPLVAAPLVDGGFVVVWHDPSVHTFLGRRFDADGATIVPTKFLGNGELDIMAIAGGPMGGFVAIGTLGTSSLGLALFDAQLTLLATDNVALLPASDRPLAALARDAAGRMNVVWGGHRVVGQTATLLAPRDQPLDPNGAPRESVFELSALPTGEVATALLASGSFVNAWSSDDAGVPRGWANVISLCTPDVHTCGDGVVDPRCEECDDGIANSDTTPDACRPTCRVAHCGDGTVDNGESCDLPGGACSGCDQCQPTVGLACGDGILVAGCADQCDDGNAVAGDGCSPQCRHERVPGGGTARTDCLTEWIVSNPTNVPLTDGHGAFVRTQRCVDNDPACDFDGGVAGRCTFHVSVCASNTDVPGCAPPGTLASWILAKPSSTARKPELLAVHAAFAGVADALVGVSGFDVCTSPIDVVVPMRGAATPFRQGKVALKSTAASPDGTRDKDALKLACLPPS